MQCAYCNSHFIPTPDVAIALMKTGCPCCGARSFEGGKNLAETSGSVGGVGIPVESLTAIWEIGSADPVGWLGNGGIYNHRQKFIQYSATSGSTGYYQGRYHDWSGSGITEKEFLDTMRTMGLHVVYA